MLLILKFLFHFTKKKKTKTEKMVEKKEDTCEKIGKKRRENTNK